MAKKTKKPYQITRRRIANAAHSFLGLPFVHQGRSAETGVDCVGLLVLIGKKIRYPEILDVVGYRKTPKADVIRETLSKNLDEIPIEEAKAGDVYLMKFGLKPRHTAIRVSDETDLENGVEPMLIHAFEAPPSGRVIKQAVRDYEQNIVAAFRIRGLKD